MNILHLLPTPRAVFHIVTMSGITPTTPKYQDDVSSGHDEKKMEGPDTKEKSSDGKTSVDLENGQGGAVDGYRTVGKWGCLFALITNQLGLGVLSLPYCLKTLGLIPGLIAIVGTGFLSWYTAMHIYRFYCKHPHVTTIVECLGIVGGRPFEIFAACLFLIQLLMTASSAVVTLSIAFNTMSNHAVCTVGFMAIATLACFLLCAPRTIKFVAQSGIPTFLSIICAALTVIIALAIKGPNGAPEDWTKDYQIVAYPSFRDFCTAFFQVLFSFAGHHAFISYMAEMRDPKKDFPFSITGLSITSTILYSIIAISIYCLAGSNTVSPALGSATNLASKVAYGLVLPAILTTGLSSGHVGIKYVYINLMKKMGAAHELTDNTVRSWTVWIGLGVAFWIITFVISNAIPVFDSILSICSAS